jgi:hypothetical protein
MAYDEAIRSITLDADATIAVYTGPPGVRGSADPNGGFQYRFVKITGANTAGLATGATNEIPIGVLQNKPQVTGAAATIAIRGVSRAVAGGVITAGDPVKLDSDGKVVTATLAADNAKTVAVALAAATAEDEIIPVLILGARVTAVETHTHA